MTPGTPDPRHRLNRIRNIIIGVIIVVAALAMTATCTADVTRSGARNYVTSHYSHHAALDEGAVKAYVADGSPATVAAQIRNAEKPIDQRTATPATLTTGGQSGTFLQYPDYVIGLFDYGTDQTRVMVSKDYTTGYTHYHNYVGRHWVPTPAYSGSGSSNRGGGSGSGK
ncbi:DUF4247 domain-containing protein [Gordonia sp. (in: high G+C Gram-positive bacteria)]|jgi:hypothetical protein|uniref:DUF4247 domain-containing protein n=1 Tax=Gordonia sp. (in: high G+C Gram-positive bacteria) TaxID=84139 RepID=UPI001DACC8E6|nr:DUF4247 domain-containing protein [Gordonia sp. (in: high G+C Gram-positive bacteria)]MCB1293231.1 DUF4247 domain-containing protein [Gordonia sp. (in: high G+C Gram-positive bacteria)]HMS75983.1 DUF4247 domain-containing protein [Gordonia sp. (in: high G+C Gram-positive bacteria)]HQV19614.1 DUF4247 domain-containing protein [Gordonia sp. (in: high G+C Gram-positive bacteria)]